MKFFNLALVTLLGLGSFSAKAMESEATTQNINSILLDIINSLNNDIQSYQQMEFNLNAMINTFDAMDQARQIFFENMYNTLAGLTNQIDTLIGNATAKDSTIQELETQIQTIRTESEQQIAELQTMIATLSTQLQEAELAYVGLDSSNEEKSAIILENMNNLKAKYNALVGLRTSFLSLVKSLNTRLQNYNNTFTTDQQSLLPANDQPSENETTSYLETIMDINEQSTLVKNSRKVKDIRLRNLNNVL